MFINVDFSQPLLASERLAVGALMMSVPLLCLLVREFPLVFLGLQFDVTDILKVADLQCSGSLGVMTMI